MAEPVTSSPSKRSWMFKVSFLGEAGVGKTWLILTYTNQIKPGESVPHNTVINLFQCSDFITTPKGNKVVFTLWEIPGHNPFHDASPQNTDCFLMLFDLTRKKTLDSVVKEWSDYITEFDRKHVTYLVGTKSDLEENREVSHERGQIVADGLGVKQYFEVSSYQRYNVDKLFVSIAEDLEELYQ